MCLALGVSRSGYYRELAEQAPDEEAQLVRAAIQEIVLHHRQRYGYRRVTAELRRQGLAVNHKRVVRMMREDNLLAIGRRKFILTTDSAHPHEVFLNLAARMHPDGLNQLWVADLTYVRLAHEFVYLAVVIDRYSRRVVGWALDRSLSARVAMAAVEQAIRERNPLPGLVHHSDRGMQYSCREYVELLQKQQIVSSMSRPANPYDNAFCESFMKTLKREEIYCNQYRDMADLSQHIGEFIDQYYNLQRLHSALGYQTPQEFEQETAARQGGIAVPPAMSFFRHEEIYQSDVSTKP